MVATKDKSGWEGLVRGAGDQRLGGGRSKRVGSGWNRGKLCKNAKYFAIKKGLREEAMKNLCLTDIFPLSMSLHTEHHTVLCDGT